MSPLALIPNAEALVGKWLREHAEIQALDARVAGRTPDTLTLPWVRVTLIAATENFTIGRELMHTHFLQLDCYAGKSATDSLNGQSEAWTLKATARAVLKAIEGTAPDGVAVSSVVFNGDSRIPDTTMEPARERYILSVEVMMRALSA